MEYSVEPVTFDMAPSSFYAKPWNFVTFDLAAAEFHGIPWNIPCNL